MLTSMMPSCCGAVELGRVAEQAETRIVDEVLDLDACVGERRGNRVAGVGLLEIAGNHDRRAPAGGGDFARQRASGDRRGAPSAQHDGRCAAKTRARFGADSRRGPRYQRHPLGHDQCSRNSMIRDSTARAAVSAIA